MNILTIPAEEAKALVARCIARGILPGTTKPPGPLRPNKLPAPKPVTRIRPSSPAKNRAPGEPTEFQRLALVHRVSQSTISKWMRNGSLTRAKDGSWTLNRRSRGKPLKYDWTRADWTLTNEQIAATLGCSARTVSNMRPALRAISTKPQTP